MYILELGIDKYYVDIKIELWSKMTHGTSPEETVGMSHLVVEGRAF